MRNMIIDNYEIEYIPVSEDTPPIEKGYKNLSREVEVITKNNEKYIAFFDYNKFQWRNAKTIKIIRNVIAWRDK